jgi:hypothetical protein
MPATSGLHKGSDKSLTLQGKQVTGLKKSIYSTYPPPPPPPH